MLELEIKEKGFSNIVVRYCDDQISLAEEVLSGSLDKAPLLINNPYFEDFIKVAFRLDTKTLNSLSTLSYYDDSLLHRPDGPAVIHPNGDYEWYLGGKRHRVGGPALQKNECEQWFIDGKCHREDGPAFIYYDHFTYGYNGGFKQWYKEGKLHRVDGPARLYSNGSRSWVLNDNQLSKEDTKIVEKIFKGNLSIIPLVMDNERIKPFCEYALSKGVNS